MRPIYAYKRAIVGGYNYNITDSDLLYNHSCVVKKKRLNSEQIAKKEEFVERKLALRKEEEEFIKEVLK